MGSTTPKWAILTCESLTSHNRAAKPLSYVESYVHHILFIMEPPVGFEPTACSLQVSCTTTVLWRQINTTRQISQSVSCRFLMFTYFTRPIEQPELSKSLSRPCTFWHHVVPRFIYRTHDLSLCFAEAEGFEPPEPVGSPVFLTTPCYHGQLHSKELSNSD